MEKHSNTMLGHKNHSGYITYGLYGLAAIATVKTGVVCLHSFLKTFTSFF